MSILYELDEIVGSGDLFLFWYFGSVLYLLICDSFKIISRLKN